MEHKFPGGIFHPEKQDYLFRCSIASGDFLLERPERRLPFTLQPDSSSVPLQTKRRQKQFF